MRGVIDLRAFRRRWPRAGTRWRVDAWLALRAPYRWPPRTRPRPPAGQCGGWRAAQTAQCPPREHPKPPLFSPARCLPGDRDLPERQQPGIRGGTVAPARWREARISPGPRMPGGSERPGDGCRGERFTLRWRGQRTAGVRLAAPIGLSNSTEDFSERACDLGTETCEGSCGFGCSDCFSVGWQWGSV